MNVYELIKLLVIISNREKSKNHIFLKAEKYVLDNIKKIPT